MAIPVILFLNKGVFSTPSTCIDIAVVHLHHILNSCSKSICITEKIPQLLTQFLLKKTKNPKATITVNSISYCLLVKTALTKYCSVCSVAEVSYVFSFTVCHPSDFSAIAFLYFFFFNITGV